MRIFKKWVLAIALFVSLTVDGSLAHFLNPLLNFHNWGANSWLLPIGIMLIALFDDMNSAELWLSLAAGVVADLANLGIIGVYAVIFPVATWACQKLARFLPEVFWSRLVIVVIGLSLMNIYVWLILNTVGIISTSLNALLISLAYNVFWSVIFFILTYWIWGNLSEAYPFLVDLDAYRQ